MKNKQIINSFNKIKSNNKEEIFEKILSKREKNKKLYLIPVFASYVLITILVNNASVKEDSPRVFNTSIEKSIDICEEELDEEQKIECEK